MPRRLVSCDVGPWHLSDIPACPPNVCLWGQSGSVVLGLSFSGFGPKADIGQHQTLSIETGFRTLSKLSHEAHDAYV
jgi:hypothetical protein